MYVYKHVWKLHFALWHILCPVTAGWRQVWLYQQKNSDAPSPPRNKHCSDNEGARWAIEGAIAIVYVVFTTVLQRQCSYLLTVLYTNKDILLINSDLRLHRVGSQVILHSFRFTPVHINMHDGPYKALSQPIVQG